MARDLKFRITLQNLLKGGLDTAVRQIRGFAQTVDGIKTRIANSFSGLRLGLIGWAGAIGGVMVAARAMRTALEKSFEMERYKTQFAVLLGSVDAAKQRMAELVKFAAETPFEMPEIAKASKQLEVLTGGVLGGAESLRLVGDAAAIAGQPISDVAMWVGRAYDAIKSGRPFGEAAMRLQEMGILSGVARAKIEELQTSGANTAEVWGVLRSALEKSSGGMVVLSQTGEGLVSTLRDNVSQAAAQVGDHFQDLAKDKIKTLIDWIGYLQESRLDAWVENVVGAVSTVGSAIGWVVDKFKKAQDGFRGIGGMIGTLIGGGTLDEAIEAGRSDTMARTRREAAERAAAAAKRKAAEAPTASTAAADAQKAREAADLAANQPKREPEAAAEKAASSTPSFRAARDKSSGSYLGYVRAAIQSGNFASGPKMAMSESAMRFRRQMTGSGLPGSVGLSSKSEIASKQEFLQSQTLKAIRESTDVLRKGLLGD